MLLCVSLVWPTKFANTLSFMQNWFDDWKFMENVRIFNFGKIGLNSLFLKIISSHTHAFCSSISMLWVVPKFFFKNCVFPQNFVSFYLFRLIQSVFWSIEIVLNCLRKPLSVSIDPICFSINRNCLKIFKKASVCFNQSKLIFDQSKLVNQVFKKSEFDISKRFSNFFSLSELDKASPQFFVIFLRIFCKVFLFISR